MKYRPVRQRGPRVRHLMKDQQVQEDKIYDELGHPITSGDHLASSRKTKWCYFLNTVHNTVCGVGWVCLHARLPAFGPSEL